MWSPVAWQEFVCTIHDDRTETHFSRLALKFKQLRTREYETTLNTLNSFIVLWCLKHYLYIFLVWSLGVFFFYSSEAACTLGLQTSSWSDNPLFRFETEVHFRLPQLKMSLCSAVSLLLSALFFPFCPLCIFDKLAHSKGIVKTSNFLKYRERDVGYRGWEKGERRWMGGICEKY